MPDNFTIDNIDATGTYLTKERYQSLITGSSERTNFTEIHSWGRNHFGQLGDNTVIDRSSPVKLFNDPSNWITVSGHGYTTAALDQSGKLWTWGLNDAIAGGYDDSGGILGIDQLSGGDRSSPGTIVSAVTNWKTVSQAGTIMAGINDAGSLYTWGLNTIAIGGTDLYTGLLGQSLGTAIDSDPTPSQVLPSTFKVNQVRTSIKRSAAIRTSGLLFTWGSSEKGALGQGALIDRSSPQSVLGTYSWKSVSLGVDHAIGISNTTMLVFGDNTYGQLGTNDTVARSSPIINSNASTGWNFIDAGGDTSAGIKTNGTLWTWGYNGSGQIGNHDLGFLEGQSSPQTTVAGGTDWRQVSVGIDHMAAIKTNGTLWTWGDNTYGQLGDGQGGIATNRSSPQTTLSGGLNWLRVVANYESTQAIKSRDFQ